MKVHESPCSPRKSQHRTSKKFPTTGEEAGSPEQSGDLPYTKRNIVKNLFVLNFGTFLTLMTFLTLSDLQSTINSYQGLGSASQAAIYASAMVACLLLPQLAIKSLGCKWTIALSLSCYLPYTLSNYRPAWGTLIPTAALQGLSFGTLTTTYATYVHEMALGYGRLARADDHEAIEALFFGVYSFMGANTQIWGNLASFLVLRPSEPLNSTASVEEGCGVDFGGFYNGTDLAVIQEPPDEKRDLLVTIFASINVLSVALVVLFLDPLRDDVDRERAEGGRCRSLLNRLTAAAKQATKVDQCLLVPISAYCGLKAGFYISEFTQAFISCSWGVYHVGFVTMWYGASGMPMSILVGPLVKLISQTSVIIVTAVINIVTYGVLFFWKPSPEFPVLYFVFAGLLGVTEAIWWSQIPALHGIMFSDDREAAFSNFFFWANFGSFVSFTCSNLLTVTAVLNILITVVVVGTVLYVIGQIKFKSDSALAGYDRLE